MGDKTENSSTEAMSTKDWLSTVLYTSNKDESKFVATWALQRIGTRKPVKEYLHSIWDYRAFILFQSQARAFATARNSSLGRVWLILEPFLSAGVYYVIFGLLLQTSRGVENFVAYLVVGVSFFAFMQKSLSRSGTLIRQNANIIRSFAFPRATLIVSDIVMRAIDTLPLICATLIFIVAMPPHAIPTWTWILVIPIHLLMLCFSMGLMFVITKLTVLVKDLRHIWPLLSRFWFYSSGVFFSIDRFATQYTVLLIMNYNPAYVVLTMYRQVLIYGTVPDMWHWLYFSCWALTLMCLGFIFFWSSEERYGQRNI
ncbi:MAG: ABC transporter permease [Actinomycetaceae bacterium]|nr:ABC transporter permease [Actinomycetaceae bacterium]